MVSVWFGYFRTKTGLTRFFSGFGSVQFFGFRLIKPKRNRIGRFFKNSNWFFFTVWFFQLFFFNFLNLIDFLIFSLSSLYNHYIGLCFCFFHTLCCLHSFSWQAFLYYYYLYAIVFLVIFMKNTFENTVQPVFLIILNFFI